MATPVSRLQSVCSECGSPYERHRSGSRCELCAPPAEQTPAKVMHESRRGSAKSRGYGAAWRRLSRRARKLQPFCSDCGRPDQLTGDHSPRAWQRVSDGLPVRLEDIDVVCVRCNAERGPARGPDAVDRPTIGDGVDSLEQLADGMDDDGEDEGLDQRIARGEMWS